MTIQFASKMQTQLNLWLCHSEGIVTLSTLLPFHLHQENNNLLDQLELAALVIPALQHLSWLYVDMPESSTGAGASWARKSLAPAFQARPSTLYLHQFSNPFTFCAFSQVDRYWVQIDGHLYTSNKIQHIIQLVNYHVPTIQSQIKPSEMYPHTTRLETIKSGHECL